MKVKCDRVDGMIGVGDVKVFMEINLCVGYIPTTNLRLKGNAFGFNENISKEFIKKSKLNEKASKMTMSREDCVNKLEIGNMSLS